MTPFSVIVTTHKRPRFLGRAIASVQAQGAGLAQLIVVSDAPCADSYAVAAAALTETDLFIQRGGSPGPSASRNLGLRQAEGRYVVFLDDDDALSPSFFADLTPHLDGRSVIYTDYIHVLEQVDGMVSTPLQAERRSLATVSPAALMIKNLIPCSCLVYPREVAAAAAFDGSIGYEDWDYLLDVMGRAKLHHAPVTGPIIYSRPVTDNRGGDNESRLEAIYRAVYKRRPAPDLAGKVARQSFLANAGILADLDEL